MKTTLNYNYKEPSPPESKYPYLGVLLLSNRSVIVYFVSNMTGIALFDSMPAVSRVGELFDNWAEEDFVPYNGTITLENGD